MILTGNVAKDVEVHTTQSGIKTAKIILAVNRKYKNKQGEREADFLLCVAWHERAEFVEKYVTKGKKIGVVGSIQTRSYDTQDGQKRYITEIQIDEIEFLGTKEKDEEKPDKVQQMFGKGNVEMVECQDDELPFD